MESAEDYSQPPAREMGVPAAWCHRYADLIHIVILLEVLEMECPQMVLSPVCVMSAHDEGSQRLVVCGGAGRACLYGVMPWRVLDCLLH
jgi:hypothetical protein